MEKIMSKFKTDRELCEKYAKKLDNGYYHISLVDNTFAGACYNDNTIQELRDALKQKKSNNGDCNGWKISATEWREQIEMALAAMLLVKNNDKLPS